MTLVDSEHAPRSHWRNSWQEQINGAIGRVRGILTDRSEFAIARRHAAVAFSIRVMSAFLAYLSQIVLARWLGSYEFGIYIYAWTWMVLIGGVVDLGLGSAAQSFIPEYTENKRFALLRGYLTDSRWLVLVVGVIVAVISIAVITIVPGISSMNVATLCLAFLVLPAFGIAQVQSGISRSYSWVNLGLMPTYVLRQLLLLALLGVFYMLELRTNAATAMLISLIAIWTCTLGQLLVLNRRLATVVEPGTKAYEIGTWLKTSMPISLTEVFFYLLTYSDVIVISQFRPPDDVSIYYAATKTLSLVAFIYFAVTQTVAHKFKELHVSGDHQRLNEFIGYSIRMTFWPSLGLILILLALGVPFLRMFGTGFESGYSLMFIIAIGLLARASVGPAERLLNMLGERRSCVLVYASSFLINLCLCLVLVPPFGIVGAAAASAVTLVIESACLFLVAKYRLGYHCLVFGRPQRG